MKLSFAKSISFIFNPIVALLATAFLLTYKTTGDLHSAMSWTGYTLFFLFLITLFILYCVRKKVFTDMDVSRREQRPLLFVVGLLAAILYLVGLIFLNGPAILFLITFGVVIGIFFASIINIYVKASIHVSTISALILALIFAFGGGFSSLLLLLIPLVAWSRLETKRHTLQETFLGAILGIVLSLVMYALMRVFLIK